MQKKTRNICVSALAVGLVLTVSIGGTLAYMTRETEKRVNNFTFADDTALNAMLTEPAWDGVIDYVYAADGSIENVIYDYIDDDNDPSTPEVPVYGYTGGDRSQPVTDPAAAADRGTKPTMDSNDSTYLPVYGAELSKNMIPGQLAPKDPKITNTGTLLDEWVAAKLTFVYGEGSDKAGQPVSATDIAIIMDAIEIDWNVGTDADSWDRVGGAAADASQTFYYQSILEKAADNAGAGVYGDETTPIFNSIKVKESVTSAELKRLEDLGGFTIFIEGFAAQSSVGATYSEFKAWAFGTDAVFGADDNVVFSNTPTDDKPLTSNATGILPADPIVAAT